MELELQKALPVYVRQQVAMKIKDLQKSYDATKSLRPQVIGLKNMCIKEGKMSTRHLDMLTNERFIVNTVAQYMNGDQVLVDIAILMTMYAKAVGGAEHVTLVFNGAQGVHPLTGQVGPIMTCSLCTQEPRTCGAYIPGFGHPTEEMGYVYYVCGVTHMPPTSSTGDEQLRNKVMERLKVAHDQLEALKQKKEEKEVVQEKSKT